MAESETSLLEQWRDGDPEALHRLVPLLYDNLHRLAGALMRGERVGHTLQPTALIHEAYMRLPAIQSISYSDRTHFLALVATTMRRVLVDHARGYCADKRGGDCVQVPLEEAHAPVGPQTVDIVDLDAALTRLAAIDTQLAQVVELRYFGGLTTDEIATMMGIGPATVKRKWALAKAFLCRTLQE